MSPAEEARAEYFDQIISNASLWISAFNGQRDTDKYKERILSITLDPYQALQKRVEELEAAGMALIQAMNQKDVFLEGYKNGSASISEASSAMADEHVAYVKLFDTIKTKQS